MWQQKWKKKKNQDPTRNLTKLSSENVCQCGCRTTLHNALHNIPQTELSAIHSSVDTLEFMVPEYPHSCSNANVSAALFGKLLSCLLTLQAITQIEQSHSSWVNIWLAAQIPAIVLFFFLWWNATGKPVGWTGLVLGLDWTMNLSSDCFPRHDCLRWHDSDSRTFSTPLPSI